MPSKYVPRGPSSGCHDVLVAFQSAASLCFFDPIHLHSPFIFAPTGS